MLLLSSPWKSSVILAAILLMALVTVAEPWLGIALLLIFWFCTASFIWPMSGFLLVYATAMLLNINIVYDSPIRVPNEIYSVFIVLPLLLLPVIMGRLLTSRYQGNTPQPDNSINAPLLFFLFWILASYGWTMDIYHGVNLGIKLFFCIGIYFLVLHYVKDRKSLETTLLFTFYWGIVLALMMVLSNKLDPDSILQPVRIQLAPDWDFKAGLHNAKGRPGGFAHANVAGTFTTFIFMLGCAIWPLFRWKGKVFLVLMAPFLISNILSTGSKGATGAFIIAFLVFLSVYPGLKGKRVLLIPTFLASMLLIFIFNVLVLQADRLAGGGDMNTMSLTLRIEFWKTGFSILEERLVGAGLGGFAHLIDPRPGGAHSYYLSILFDSGIVGLCLFLIFLFSLAVSLIRVIAVTNNSDVRRYLYCLGTVLVAFFIHSLVEFSYHSSHIWVIFGIILATIRIAQNDCIECRTQNY